MHRPHEHRTDAHPDQGRQPTPDHRQSRTHNRGGSRNGAIVMAEQNPALCRHEIHTVFELARRNQFILPEGEDFLRQKPGIEAVAKGKGDKDDSSESSGVHNVPTLASRHHPVQKLTKKGRQQSCLPFPSDGDLFQFRSPHGNVLSGIRRGSERRVSLVEQPMMPPPTESYTAYLMDVLSRSPGVPNWP